MDLLANEGEEKSVAALLFLQDSLEGLEAEPAEEAVRSESDESDCCG